MVDQKKQRLKKAELENDRPCNMKVGKITTLFDESNN